MPGTGAALALALATAIHGPTATPGAAAGAGDTDIVALRIDPADRMTVPVSIGTHGTFRFLIDTGAQNTVISSELALRLALAPSATALVIGTAGEMRVAVVRLDGLMLGSRSFDGLDAPLLRAGDIGADGAVGLDSLQHSRVVLDFVKNTIAVSEAQTDHDSGYEIVVRARRRSGQLIITNATIDDIPVDVVVDTGSNVTIGNPALAAALAKRGPRTPTTLYSMTGQQIAASVGVSRALVLGQLRLGNVPIAYADAPPFGYLGLARRPAILLGMSELRAFKRVAIDFDKRKVMFDLPPQPMGIVRAE
jgi:predicted aspartyl protease